MPIFANNIVYKKDNDTKQMKDFNEVVSYEKNKDHHTLIVNGKEKKIGKKSQYLLNMLTLDD
ncbi:hypothetical protein EB118_10120 [bacterium]|nr:hypothetical protein [bacterium]